VLLYYKNSEAAFVLRLREAPAVHVLLALALPPSTLPALHLPSPHFLLLDALGFCCYSRQTPTLAYSACCSAKLLSTLLAASRLLPALLYPLLVPFRLFLPLLSKAMPGSYP